jgi:hypothetical protein
MKAITEMTTAEMIQEYNDLTGKSIKKFSTRAAGEKQLAKARNDAWAAEIAADEAAAAEVVEEAQAEEVAAAEVVEEAQAEEVAADEAAAAEEVAAEEVAAEEVSAEDEVWEEKKYNYSVDGCPGCGAKGDITAAGLEGTRAGERLFCHNCSTEFHDDGRIYKKRKKGNISEGVKASWQNPEVAAARAKRDAVVVEGGKEGIKIECKSVPAAFKALGLSMAKMIKFRLELKAKGTATYSDYKFTIISK